MKFKVGDCINHYILEEIHGVVVSINLKIPPEYGIHFFHNKPKVEFRDAEYIDLNYRLYKSEVFWP